MFNFGPHASEIWTKSYAPNYTKYEILSFLKKERKEKRNKQTNKQKQNKNKQKQKTGFF